MLLLALAQPLIFQRFDEEMLNRMLEQDPGGENAIRQAYRVIVGLIDHHKVDLKPRRSADESDDEMMDVGEEDVEF